MESVWFKRAFLNDARPHFSVLLQLFLSTSTEIESELELVLCDGVAGS